MKIYSNSRFYGEIKSTTAGQWQAITADGERLKPTPPLSHFTSIEEAKAVLITWGEEMEQREADAAGQDYNDSW